MGIKQIAKQLLPPIVADALRRLRRPPAPDGPPEWECVPDGWSEGDKRIKGWNEDSILETQKAKWPEYLASLQGTAPLGVAHESPVPSDDDYGAHNTLMCYAYVLALAAQGKTHLSMLDWGSGIGHYFPLSQRLLPGVDLDYSGKDMPVLARGGRELLPQATFYDNEDEALARRYDFVLASCSLHYSQDWKAVVSRLAAATNEYLFVTRLPIVHEAASFPVVQRPYRYGYDTEYVGWFLNRQEFLGHLDSLGMELMREFLIQERPLVHNAPEQGEYRGFLFKSRNAIS